MSWTGKNVMAALQVQTKHSAEIICKCTLKPTLTDHCPNVMIPAALG